MLLKNHVEFYEQFLEELLIRFDLAVLTGHLVDGSRIAVVSEFVKWVRDDIAADARVARRGGSFLYHYAFKEWVKLKPQLIQADFDFVTVADATITRYLADEANPEEQAAVIETVGKYPKFKELAQTIKEKFRARPEDRCYQPAQL